MRPVHQWMALAIIVASQSMAGAQARQASTPAKPGSTATPADAKAAQPAAAAAGQPPKIRFKPPAGIGSASNAVAGGTRGATRELVIFVAAPSQVGLTASAQPDLYWYVSRPLTLAPEFMLVEVGGTQALVERKLTLPTTAGFQRIALKDLGVELQEGREYMWQISLGSNARGGSGGLIDASGRVRRQALPAELAGKVAAEDTLAAAAVYAESGYWYDAVMRLRDKAGRTGGFSEPEIGLFESAGLGQLIRRATDSGN